MGNHESTISKRSMLLALIAAVFMAMILSLGMAQPAEAASTSKPYAGYKNASKEVVSAGYIQMYTYDARKVKKGMSSFCVWSGNSKLYDADGNYTKTATVLKKYKMKGVTYNKKKNTLTLKNVNAPTYTLGLHGMGSGFKINLVGKNALAGIESRYAAQYNSKGESTGKYYPSSLTITGSGSLVVNKNKYNSSAISLQAYGTASKLVIDKKAKVTLYAYGVGNVVSVSSGKTKKAAQAISIKGWAAQDLQYSSQTNKGSVYYQDEGVTVVETAAESRPLYKIGTAAQLYYSSYDFNRYEGTGVVDEFGDEVWDTVDYRTLVPVKAITVGKTTYYAALSSGSKDVKASEATQAVASAKVITSTYDRTWMTKLNKGAYYGTAGSKSVSYWDPSARRSYNSKWHIYKKVATIEGRVYVTSFKDNVANKGPLPKGYTGVKETSYGGTGTTYTHVLKNNMLTIAA